MKGAEGMNPIRKIKGLAEKIKAVPGKIKRQARAALLLACLAATFAAPVFGGGYNALQSPDVTSQAMAIEDIDLMLVGATAFGEARKTVYASDNDAVTTFVNNTYSIISSKWQNVGLLMGGRDTLSMSTWDVFMNPLTLSDTEIVTYCSYLDADYKKNNFANAYNRYKAFGYAIQKLNKKGLRSRNTSVGLEEGLDAMSAAAIKLGNFGTEFLNQYNPGPVLLALYDSSYLSTYSGNRLVQIVVNNQTLKNIVCLFGDKVGSTGLSFFVLVNIVIAVVCLAFSMLLTLLGNRNIGDGIRKFLSRVIIGTVGIYLISNILSTSLSWVSSTILNVEAAEYASYVENNLNFYDWYQTGFQLPAGTTLKIDSSGQFVFDQATVRAINTYTYERLVGPATDENMRARMESYTSDNNHGFASFITPSQTHSTAGDAEAGGAAWATDAYYAIMKNFAENKTADEGGLLAGKDEEGSPLAGAWSVLYSSQYFRMSSLLVNADGSGGWNVSNYTTNYDYYGVNPISAFNIMRTDFSGSSITATNVVHPEMAYVAFDAVNVVAPSGAGGGSTNMNSITRFIATFTLILAAMKGLITIITAGFGGLIAGGAKTATGSAGGLGQALGAVVALIFGIVGISVIMSMILSLVDVLYGIAKDLLTGTEVIEDFLGPIIEPLGDIPFGIGDAIAHFLKGFVETVLTLVLALTFPKLGGIPITIFSQFMADLPGKIAEKAQMLEGMLMSGRNSAGGGLGSGGRGQYGRQASAMAGQAFQSGTKQALGVMRAAAGAAASLAGAGLAAAGRGMNKAGDSVEGKPSNPGIGNWDEMSPEQQAAAAEVAANTADWADMDEDARQDALDKGGVYGENAGNAEGPGGAQDGNENGNADGDSLGDNTETEELAEGEQETLQDGEEPETPNADTEMPTDVLPDDSVSPTDVTPGDSIAGTELSGTDTSGTPGDASGTQAESVSGNMETGGETAGSRNGESAGTNPAAPAAGTSADSVADSGTDSGSGTGQADAGDGGVTNVSESSYQEAGDQTLNASSESTNSQQVQDVDRSSVSSDETAVNEGGLVQSSENVDGRSGPAAPMGAAQGSMDQAAGGSGGTPAAGGTEVNNQVDNSSSRNDTRASQSSSSSRSSSTRVGGSSNKASVVNKGGTQAKGPGQKPAPKPVQSGQAQAQKPGQNAPKPVSQQAQKPGQKATGTGSVNAKKPAPSTAKSKYGKEMTIREQRQARFLHAAGDALQMMGGNRTVGQGISDALGYAGEGLMNAVIPPEITNGLAQDIRNRRNLRSELRRHERQQGHGQQGRGQQ